MKYGLLKSKGWKLSFEIQLKIEFLPPNNDSEKYFVKSLFN